MTKVERLRRKAASRPTYQCARCQEPTKHVVFVTRYGKTRTFHPECWESEKAERRERRIALREARRAS